MTELTLGWKLNYNTLSPNYWLKEDAKAGEQADDDLVKVKAESLGCHTAIIAQSGSGKSFFIGRLIEEISLETKARCLIIDPNADFRMINEVVESKFWENAKYDHKTGRGRLPHEKTREDFDSRWSQISKRVFVGSGVGDTRFTPIHISLPTLSSDFFTEEIDPMMRSKIYHCHELVKSLATLYLLKSINNKNSNIDLLDKAEKILRIARSDNGIRKALYDEFDEEEIISKIKGANASHVGVF